MVTVLWCYLRNSAFKIKGADGKTTDYHLSADLTGQANHLGVTIEADIIKQKLPENNGGDKTPKIRENHKRGYNKPTPRDHPSQLTRYPPPHRYKGPPPLIKNGGGAAGAPRPPAG